MGVSHGPDRHALTKDVEAPPVRAARCCDRAAGLASPAPDEVGASERIQWTPSARLLAHTARSDGSIAPAFAEVLRKVPPTVIFLDDERQIIRTGEGTTWTSCATRPSHGPDPPPPRTAGLLPLQRLRPLVARTHRVPVQA
jgi:hypothetical protein